MTEDLLFQIGFWLNQSTVIFILGCHVYVTAAFWVVGGRWWHYLTVASVGLWVVNLLRLVQRLPLAAQRGSRMTEADLYLFALWSGVGFLLALTIGVMLRRALLEITQVLRRDGAD